MITLLCASAILISVGDETMAYQDCQASAVQSFVVPDVPMKIITAQDCKKNPQLKGCKNG